MFRTTLLKTGLTYHKSHPLQSFLIIIGITLGVAVIVAIDIANVSISRSFQYSTDSLTGQATHQIVGARAGFDQEVFTTIRVVLGNHRNTPVIEGFVQVEELGMETLKLMGVDPLSESGFRNLMGMHSEIKAGSGILELMTEPNTVMISEQLAAKAGIGAGDKLSLHMGRKKRDVRILGQLKSHNEITQNVLSGVIIADIATAQEILNMGNQISRIDLIIDENDEVERLKQLEDILPTGVNVVAARKRSESIQQMSSAFELNLKAMSLLALLVGMFLIYNTITFSVVQRRKLLGILRTLGTTRIEVFFLILTEAMVMGLIGSLLGLGLGIILGFGTVNMVIRTVSDLFFVLNVPAYGVSIPGLVKALGLGLLSSVISALFPAYEAVRVSPVVTQQRSSLEQYATTVLPLLTISGLVLAAAGGIILRIESTRVELSFGGLFCFVFGAALMVPALSQIIIRIFILLPGVRSRLGLRWALRNVSRSLSRTAVAIAALMIAVSVIVGVGIMVGSFRYTVIQWLKDTIRADIYIVSTSRNTPGLSPDIMKTLERIDGIKEIYPARSFRLNSGPFIGATVFVIEKEIIKRDWIWRAGANKKIYQMFRGGSVFVSETFAWKNGIENRAGGLVRLQTPYGEKQFPIAGIFRDFSSRQGMIVMDAGIYEAFWGEQLLSGIGLITHPGIDVEKVIDRINKQLARQHNFAISSNITIRKGAIAVFDRTFTITIALQILAALVAFIGVFNSIMSMMLERTHEIGIIRANGMTVRQLWRMVLTESGIIGLISGLLAIPLGSAMAWILVFTINKRSFGWTLDFIVEPSYYLQAVGIALIASLLAGIYPAYSIGRTSIIAALRAE